MRDARHHQFQTRCNPLCTSLWILPSCFIRYTWGGTLYKIGVTCYYSHIISLFVFTLFVLIDLILYVPSTIFQFNRDGSSWAVPVLSKDKCVLLKDHNAVTAVRLEPAAPLSQVKHSTTEPLRSCFLLCKKCYM